jgi:hypothetical protein
LSCSGAGVSVRALINWRAKLKELQKIQKKHGKDVDILFREPYDDADEFPILNALVRVRPTEVILTP